MTTTAFLSGQLPSGESNGLAAIVRQLLDDPEAVHVLVVLADVVKVTHKVESGDRIPTVRIRRIEPIADAGDRAQLQRLLMREYERRTGQPTLPIELEQDVEAAFGDATDDDPPPPPKPPKRKRGTVTPPDFTPPDGAP
jgi:hypothetical protein